VGAGNRFGIPHLTSTLSAPQWSMGGGEGDAGRPPARIGEMNAYRGAKAGGQEQPPRPCRSRSPAPREPRAAD